MNVHSPVYAPSASSAQLDCIFGPIAARVTAKELSCLDLSKVLSQFYDGAGQLLTANERFPLFVTCSSRYRHVYLKDQMLPGGLSRWGSERDALIVWLMLALPFLLRLWVGFCALRLWQSALFLRRCS
jgi:hypothetical protein